MRESTYPPITANRLVPEKENTRTPGGSGQTAPPLLSHISHHCDKILDNISLKKGRFLSAPGSAVVGCEAAAHFAFLGSRDKRVCSACLLLLIQSRTPDYRAVLPTSCFYILFSMRLRTPKGNLSFPGSIRTPGES